MAKSQSEPLIVDWKSVDRARLEALSRSGLVAVKYSGCEMRVISNCSIPNAPYRYVGTTRKHDEDHIRTSDELYAKLPLGAASLEGTLKRAGELSVGMTIVGRYQFDPSVKKADLQGECSEATHVITALTVGAFAFQAGASANVGGGVSAFGAGVKGGSEASHDVLSQDGVDAECEKAGDDDKRAPAGCGALIRIELRVLPETVVQVMQEERAKSDDEQRLERKRQDASKFRTWSYVVGGTGLGLLATGGLFFALGSSAKTSIADGGLATSAEIESAAGRVNAFRGVSYGAFGVGGALLLTGISMLIWGPTVPDAKSAVGPGVVRW